MRTSDVSILVVDDSQSATNVIEQILFNSNFFNLHFCKGAVDALQFLESNPTQILVTEWHLADLDGLELAQHVKEMDAGKPHYTYTIVFSDCDPDDALRAAFRSSVDAFLNRKDLHSQLVGMMLAAERISSNCERLASENVQLKLEVDSLKAGQLLDPLTGLGNRKMAEQSLSDVIKQIESRGGAVCYLLMGIANYDDLIEQKSQKVADEMIVAIAKRLHNLVRPLDVATYLGHGRFALVLMQPTIEQCTRECYRRIHDGIGLKSYQTTAGYITAQIGTSICASEALTGPPNLTTIMSHAEAGLKVAYRTNEITVHLLGVEQTNPAVLKDPGRA